MISGEVREALDPSDLLHWVPRQNNNDVSSSGVNAVASLRRSGSIRASYVVSCLSGARSSVSVIGNALSTAFYTGKTNLSHSLSHCPCLPLRLHPFYMFQCSGCFHAWPFLVSTLFSGWTSSLRTGVSAGSRAGLEYYIIRKRISLVQVADLLFENAKGKELRRNVADQERIRSEQLLPAERSDTTVLGTSVDHARRGKRETKTDSIIQLLA